MSVIAATAADNLNKGLYPNLADRLSMEGIPLIVEEMKSFSWAALVQWEAKLARAHPKDILVFVDAWDFLMLGRRDELEALATEQDVLLHSDAHCWPEPHKADLYPPCASRYRYVNGTGPMGKGEAIADLIDFGMDRFPIRGFEKSIFADNDQRFFTDVFLYQDTGHSVKIDTSCRLSVALNSLGDTKYDVVGKRLLLYPLGTMPIFLHANGAARHRLAPLVERLR